MKLSTRLENCFGIRKFEYVFDFGRNNSILIYSPNGTMKSSFAKTFMYYSKNEYKNIKDRLHPERLPIVEIKDEKGDNIPNESIYVANGDDSNIDASDCFSTFLASREVKDRYDKVYKELNEQKQHFISKLGNAVQSPDCEKEISVTFSTDLEKLDDFYTIIKRNKEIIQKEHPKFNFRYNAVFDNEGKIKSFVNKHSDLFKSYFESYIDLLKKSDFFHFNGNNVSFGSYQAHSLLNAVKDKSFFEVGHSIKLSNGNELKSFEQLEGKVQTTLQQLLTNPSLQKKLAKLIKDLDANENTRECKQVLENDPSLVQYFLDYENFQKEYWYGYFHAFLNDINALIKLFEDKQAELTQILAESRKQLTKWHKIVETYNERFHVPFKVEIGNVEDIVLKEEVAQLKFTYTDQDKLSIPTDRKTLFTILSRGELRAFFIMQILFEIEARKTLDNISIVVFDDIADSFDYNNKFAIIEYINDMNISGKFQTIILTHNFDFYRTLSSRLNLGNSVYMTVKHQDGTIKLHKGEYRRDLFTSLSMGAHTDERKLISLIPFVRNLIEYTHGENSKEYLILTFCMHVKIGYTDVQTIGDIIQLMKKAYPARCNNISAANPNENIKSFIYRIADAILEETNIDQVLIENKIVLSIASRLKAESYMIEKLLNHPEAIKMIQAITKNQAREIFKIYTKYYSDKLYLLELVNLMTPEGIHLNSFMYEPLIDMSLDHLLQLYHDCKLQLI